MNTLSPNYKIRAARLEDLAMLVNIKSAATKLFCHTPYAFLVDAEPLPLNFVIQQFAADRVWVAVDNQD
jgi:hypothetical protein